MLYEVITHRYGSGALLDQHLTTNKGERNAYNIIWTKCRNNWARRSYITRSHSMVVQESDNNLLLSCEAHGKETYFNIKKMEKKKNMRCYVYVWFKRKKQAEKMCRITSYNVCYTKLLRILNQCKIITFI